MVEVENLFSQQFSKIEFETLYIDQVSPGDEVVKDILEIKSRLITNTVREYVKKPGTNTITAVVFPTTSQNRGRFSIDDPLVYFKEIDDNLNNRGLSLAPCSMDRLFKHWKETLRVVYETKAIDRCNDYKVTLSMGVTHREGNDWSVNVEVATRAVSIDPQDKWVIMENYVQRYT